MIMRKKGTLSRIFRNVVSPKGSLNKKESPPPPPPPPPLLPIKDNKLALDFMEAEICSKTERIHNFQLNNLHTGNGTSNNKNNGNDGGNDKRNNEINVQGSRHTQYKYREYETSSPRHNNLPDSSSTSKTSKTSSRKPSRSLQLLSIDIPVEVKKKSSEPLNYLPQTTQSEPYTRVEFKKTKYHIKIRKINKRRRHTI